MVNRVLVERILTDIKSNLQDLKNASDITWEVYVLDKRARRFVERTLHIMIEACIDIAQHIISDRQLREPANYRDTFVVLAENGIIDVKDLKRFENMASFRNLLVHYYERIDDEVVFGIFKRNLSDFEMFIHRIVAYLDKEEKA
ncbi:MAG: DUF86 domain-containing protein [Deltaproteobacteria bacterium]|nr:DUF86 domain-containing protein [Deltaproteobacteria bacterium]